MWQLEDIRNNIKLANMIDWDMTPEEAVILYLEWGNNWSHGKFVKSKQDVSYYFIVDTWNNTPMVYLVRRDSDEAVELAAIGLPRPLRENFLVSVGHNRGVYAINREIRTWLEKELYRFD